MQLLRVQHHTFRHPARPVAQHQLPARRRTVLALLRHGYLPYSVASDAKLLETSHGLGTGVPRAARCAAAARSERGGVRKVTWRAGSGDQRLDNLILDPILVIEHDYDLKTRCYA